MLAVTVITEKLSKQWQGKFCLVHVAHSEKL